MEEATQSAYDQLRQAEFIPGAIREQWAALDLRRARYQDSLLRLSRDEDLTSEAKERRAFELEQSEGRNIEKKGKELKAALLKAAEQAYRSSLPIFSGESLNPSDPTKVLISQNEAARISARLDRAASQPGPFKRDAGDILREEYEAGLKMADTRGAAIIRGALMIADERGMGDEWIPRRERDAEYADKARQQAYAAAFVPIQAPGGPRSLKSRRLSKRPERRRDNLMLTSGAADLMMKRDESGHTGLVGSREATAPLPDESQQKGTPHASKKKRAWK